MISGPWWTRLSPLSPSFSAFPAKLDENTTRFIFIFIFFPLSVKLSWQSGWAPENGWLDLILDLTWICVSCCQMIIFFISLQLWMRFKLRQDVECKTLGDRRRPRRYFLHLHVAHAHKHSEQFVHVFSLGPKQKTCRLVINSLTCMWPAPLAE